MHKVTFEVRNVSMVGVGDECFTHGSSYTRDFEDDLYERVSSLKNNGFLVFKSDLKIDPEATVSPVVAPVEVTPAEVVPEEVEPVEAPVEVPPGVEEVILQSVEVSPTAKPKKAK